MRTALIGAPGQLGTALEECLAGEVVPLGHDSIEIADASSVEAALSAADVELVVNCAAYNFVDRAEDEPEAAYRYNALGPRNLALWCADKDVPLVHVSTDYVFGQSDRRQRPYTEDDAPQPTSAYAISKLAGEYFVSSTCLRHFIVRTCGLYGRARTPGKGNFVETMLRLGAQRDELSVVDDQRCTPTWVGDLAPAIAALTQTNAYGLYHATNAGDMTWCEFAREIFRRSGTAVDVKPITTAEFSAKANRPPYSVLDNSKLKVTIGHALPDWRDALATYLSRRDEIQ